MKVADLFAELSLKWNKGAEKKTEAQMSRFAKKTGKKMDKVASGLKSRLAGIVGITAAVFATRDAVAFGTALTRLERASKGGLGSIGDIQSKILEVSDATGIMKEDVLAGAASFISLTGDSETAGKAMGLFAKVSQATGSNMDDVARSGAALSQSMGIAGEDFEQAFSILIASGKAGSVELKDVSRVMAKLSAVSAQFAGGKGLDALASTSSALQLVTRAFGGNAKEGSNALNKLMGSMVRAAPKLKKFGVKVFDVDPKTGVKTRRAFEAIVSDIAKSKVAKDPTKLIEILGSKEALAAFEQLTKTNGEWKELTDNTRNATDVADDYAKVNKSAAIKVTKAWNKIKNTITRVFAKIVDVMALFTDHIEIVIVALGSLGLAFIILKWEAIKAAAATAVAWVAALAPLILLGLAIAAAILIAQDLWNAFSGEGKSVFVDAHEWLVDVFSDAILEWEKDFKVFFSWLRDQFQDTIDTFGDIAAYFSGKQTSIEKSEERKRNIEIRAKGLSLPFGAGIAKKVGGALEAGQSDAAFQALVDKGLSAPSVAGKGGTVGINTSLVVNVEAGANVTPETVKSITDQTQEAMARTSRQLASEAQ